MICLISLHGNRVNPGKGLVQQDEFGFGLPGLWHFQSSPFTPDRLHTQTFAYVGDMELFNQGFHLSPFAVSCPDPASFKDGHDVLFNRQFAKDRGLLGQVANPFACPTVHWQACNVLVVDQDASLVTRISPTTM